MKATIFSLIFLLSSVFLLQNIQATIGVGVGTGKITLDEVLKPGIIYELPSITVVNTGNEAMNYSVGIQYHENQPEQKPPSEWFTFIPNEFYLEPKQTQIVGIRLNLPLKAEPAEYFAYLEAFPLKKSETETTTIGVAAATKLYFTVVPANIFQAVYYKLISLWNIYYPWSLRMVILIGLIVLGIIGKKYLNIDIGLKKRNSVTKQNTK